MNRRYELRHGQISKNQNKQTNKNAILSERSQTKEMPFVGNFQKRWSYNDSRKQTVVAGGGGRQKRGLTVNEHKSSYWGDEKALKFRVMVAPFGKFTLKNIESFSWKGQIIHCAEYASIKLFYLNTIQALKASLKTFSNFSPHCSLHSSHTDLSPVVWTHQLHMYLRAFALTAPVPGITFPWISTQLPHSI